MASSADDSAAISAELAHLDAEHRRIQDRLEKLQGELNLRTLTHAAAARFPVPYHAEHQMPAAAALVNLRQWPGVHAPMRVSASAPLSRPVQSVSFKPSTTRKVEPVQRAFRRISHAQLQQLCREHALLDSGTKKQLSDRICAKLGHAGAEFIRLKAFSHHGGKSHTRRKAHCKSRRGGSRWWRGGGGCIAK